MNEGNQVDAITWSYGLSQLICKLTHILPNSSSCIHPSLHRNCHHQIVYVKLNLKIEYPTLYERLVWDCSIAQLKPSTGRN